MIPNQFHFVYGFRKQLQPFPLIHYLCLESCRQVNRPMAIHFHYQNEPWGSNWDRIRPHLQLHRVKPNRFVEGFTYRDPAIEPFRYAHHADFLRLEVLLECGGIYADIDTLFVRPLPAWLFGQQFVMGREMEALQIAPGRTESTLCNALMMSAPGSRFAARWLEQMTKAFDGSWSNHSTVLPSRLADQFPDWIHIEPRSSFFHFGPNSRGLFTLFEAPGAVPDSAYSIHLWEHLWRDRQRVDFSLIHEDMLDDDYVRSGHTTYAAAALPFLPPAESDPTGRAGSSTAAKWQRIRQAAAVWARELRLDAEALAGLLAIPLVRLVKPGFGRLHLARARWCYRRARDRFQAENALEDSILRCVILWDEYGLFHLPLAPADVVIDVGAHFGAFSFACHARGSRNIHAFEPSSALASRLRQHLAGLPGIHIHQKAVFRSDRPLEQLRHSGPLNAWNSGSGSVIFGDYAVDASSRGLLRIDGETRQVPAVSLDEILAPFERVHLLKLDCEGSEFPILLTSTQLAKVERIVGEYHELTSGEMVHLAPEAIVEGCIEFSFVILRRHLEQQGFRVESHETSEHMGIFDAVRRQS